MFAERLTPAQIAHLDEMRRALEQRLRLDEDREEMRGGMRFQAIKGRDYLVRYHYDAEGKKVFRSLGPRSPATERTLEEFMDRREAWKADRANFDFRLAHLGRFAKAHRLDRMPVLMAGAIDALRNAGLFAPEDGSPGIAIAGTSALHAYECDLCTHLPAGVIRDRSGLDLVIVAPPDRDLLTRAEAAVAEALGEARLVSERNPDPPEEGVFGYPLRVIALEVEGLDVPLIAPGRRPVGLLGPMMAVARDGRAVAVPAVHPSIWLALATRGIDEFDIDTRLQARLDFVSKGYGVKPARLPEIVSMSASIEDDEEGEMRVFR